MRVIAGEFRSRVLQSMPGLDVRPTPDRMRETLFNILAPRIEGSTFIDAYAGTGSVGIEAISRGAKLVTFIEKNRHAVDLIGANLNSLGIKAQARVIRGSAALYLASIEADIVFIDPPYPLTAEYKLALDVIAAKPPSLTIVQHSVREPIPEKYESLVRTRVVKQGDNALSFFSVPDRTESSERPFPASRE